MLRALRAMDAEFGPRRAAAAADAEVALDAERAAREAYAAAAAAAEEEDRALAEEEARRRAEEDAAVAAARARSRTPRAKRR